MKRIAICACIALALSVAANAAADTTQGRFGVTGRIGFLLPADSEFTDAPYRRNSDTDTGFIGGGGFIYGIDRNWAAELDITHSEFSAHDGFGFEGGDFATTNISLGAQYRFVNVPVKKLVPYAGAGLDILINDFSPVAGFSGNVDTVAGVHASGGVDYFIRKQLAVTGQLKAVVAPDADIRDYRGFKIGNFDPSSLSMTFGVRYFFE
ncbi:outer membrane protein [Geobacter sp. DSM 9736]|uniref:outer membrane protein n=1 Tax=Geobacter sp. DSM 9736 TaxID=1277350 RepID=UPI000B50A473|nr:outer membrane beta-barrel protein [Geobacter sp. DSM 9736]SNB45247.1 outer membrane protein [Geobacter sp. DSM 9736]